MNDNNILFTNKLIQQNLSLVIYVKTNNNIFKEYCYRCGCELEIHIDNKFSYKTYWCSGLCSNAWINKNNLINDL